MSNWQKKSYEQSLDFNSNVNFWRDFSIERPLEEGFYETREKYVDVFPSKTRFWDETKEKWFEFDEDGNFVETKIHVFYWRLIEIDFMIDGD